MFLMSLYIYGNEEGTIKIKATLKATFMFFTIQLNTIPSYTLNTRGHCHISIYRGYGKAVDDQRQNTNE